jgi:hypothetical protein
VIKQIKTAVQRGRRRIARSGISLPYALHKREEARKAERRFLSNHPIASPCASDGPMIEANKKILLRLQEEVRHWNQIALDLTPPPPEIKTGPAPHYHSRIDEIMDRKPQWIQPRVGGWFNR